MVDVTDAQLKAAEARGRKMFETEPRAVSAHYDQATGRVVVDLVNGCAYAFPSRLVQELQDASHGDLGATAPLPLRVPLEDAIGQLTHRDHDLADRYAALEELERLRRDLAGCPAVPAELRPGQSGELVRIVEHGVHPRRAARIEPHGAVAREEAAALVADQRDG